MFDRTATGYRASDELIAYWESREACPGGCGFILDPVSRTATHLHYSCPACGDAEWSREL